MKPGDVLGGRFELERRAGAGGMAEVFRARDRASGEAVAVKVLLERRLDDDARFAREGAVLSELRHPGIVRYVAHGATDAGEPYLAMEWLEGEDLSCRLRRGALTLDETLTLVMRVAEALGAAHLRGVVHRDLKPSNLFLVNRDIGRIKVLDFGIARLGGATAMTRTGTVIGTPGYMAPEQARSLQDIDARADVFSLGCVLVECLTGTPVFTGEHLMAVLAKVLFQESPRLLDLCAHVPPALDALGARMLAKDPGERPRDGAAVAAALEGLRATGPRSLRGAPLPISAPASALTGGERRVLSVVLLDKGPVDRMAETIRMTELAAAQEELRKAAETHGGHLEILADGSTTVTITRTTGIPTDQAAQAARCALALRALTGNRAMALATGRGELGGKLSIGDAIDRAARMLAQRNATDQTESDRAHAPPIAIDEVTAGLLDARFQVTRTAGGLLLHGEQAPANEARTLLGKLTACVGRDWELATLEALFTECVEDERARAVLVTAPAGMGKSRLAYEIVRRVRQRHQDVAIWTGRGDSLRAGSTFGLLGQALRGALGIQEGEPIERRWQKLRSRVAEHVTAGDQGRDAEFLGELVGTPFPDEESVPLRAARQDAQLMADQMRRAWLAFLGAEAAAQPVLIVLEDLHWGDLTTVRFIDTALQEMKRRPWMVLALSRPEIHELFPKLWADRNLQEIRLKELSRKASERLVRQVLGDAVDAGTMERLVTLADGHAFYLEELIRTVAEGRTGALPETVLSMVEARLSGFESEARRVLRAASVFGEVCWQGGVESLLGGASSVLPVADLLRTLVTREVLVQRPTSRFPGDVEFAFRHALLREGAYAMLTAEDRTLGHRLAGAWLERMGSTDALTMAEHFSRGEDPARAVRWYRRAAEQALAADDLSAVLERAERGVACGAAGEDLGALRLCEAEVHAWRGELTLVEQRAVEATTLLRPGSVGWFHAFSQAITAVGKLGNVDQLERFIDVIGATPPDAGADTARVICLCFCASYLIFAGRYSAADALIEAMERKESEGSSLEAPAVATLAEARAFRASAAGDAGRCLDSLAAARIAFEQAGDRRNACSTLANLGFIYAELGDFSGAERALRDALGTAHRMGLHDVSASVLHNLGHVLAYRGDIEEARRLETQALEIFQQRGSTRLSGLARTYLAKIELLASNPLAAEREARAAVEVLLALPPLRASAFAVLARALLAQKRADEALAAAREAFALLSLLGTLEEGESLVRLVHAEALHATGDLEQARDAIRAARDRLLANASKIGNAAYRKSFLENVPENARTLELARAWLE